MAEKVARTTISVDQALYKAAVKRAAALGYKSFSAYIEHLIKKDLEERPSHITIREEPELYLHPASSKKPSKSA